MTLNIAKAYRFDINFDNESHTVAFKASFSKEKSGCEHRS